MNVKCTAVVVRSQHRMTNTEKLRFGSTGTMIHILYDRWSCASLDFMKVEEIYILNNIHIARLHVIHGLRNYLEKNSLRHFRNYTISYVWVMQEISRVEDSISFFIKHLLQVDWYFYFNGVNN